MVHSGQFNVYLVLRADMCVDMCVGTHAAVCIDLPVDAFAGMAASGADVFDTGAEVLARLGAAVGALLGAAVGPAVGDLW